MIAVNRKNSFKKEVLLALLILGNCFIPSLHLLASLEFNSLEILGYELVHYYPSNQSFFWTVLTNFQILNYTLIFFYLCTRRYKYALLALAYWMFYGIVWDILPWADEKSKVIIQITSMFLIFGMAIFLELLRFRKQESCFNSLKLKTHRSDKIITFMLLLLPFLSRAIRFSEELQELNFLGFTITTFGFPNIHSFLGYLLDKIFLLVPVLMLFFSSKKWWRYALLFPILLAVFQIKNALDPNLEDVDAYEFVEAAPFLLLVLVLLLFLSNTAYYQSKMKELYRKTYDHVEEAIQGRFKGREYFLSQTKAKWQKMKKSNEINENELHQLKQHLEQELRKSNY